MLMAQLILFAAAAVPIGAVGFAVYDAVKYAKELKEESHE